MEDAKGKSRAKGEQDIPTPPPDSEEPSMLSRIAASASSLARSSLANPHGTELNDNAAAILANSGKGPAVDSSSGSTAAWAESSKVTQQPSTQASSSNPFRSEHTEAHVNQTESEFASFLDGIDSFTPSTNTSTLESPKDANESFNNIWSRFEVDGTVSDEAVYQPTIGEQQACDGEDVFALLLNPDPIDRLPSPPPVQDNIEWGTMSQARGQNLQNTTSMSTGNNVPSIYNDFRNLIPDFGINGASITVPLDNERILGPRRLQTLYDQWRALASHYIDEVWGDHAPQEEQGSAEEIHVEEQGPGQTALRRLGAIYRHLHG